MMRLAVLCFVFTLARSHTLSVKDLTLRDLYDEWTHLEANKIPTNTEIEDYYDELQGLKLSLPLKSLDILSTLREQPEESTTVSSTSDDVSITTEMAESGNETLLEYTEDSDGYLILPGIGRIKLFEERHPWHVARRVCIDEGGDLAVPDSEGKVAAFMKLYEMHPEIPANAILTNQVYVGIQDPEHTREFVTYKGEPVSADLPIWASGEPDDQPPGQEDCVTFRTDARIRDVPCHFSLPFFCEKPL